MYIYKVLFSPNIYFPIQKVYTIKRYRIMYNKSQRKYIE